MLDLCNRVAWILDILRAFGGWGGTEFQTLFMEIGGDLLSQWLSFPLESSATSFSRDKALDIFFKSQD